MKGKKCIDKTNYYDRITAEKEANRISKRTGKTFRVYRCEQCLNYHLTTVSQKTFNKHQRRSTLPTDEIEYWILKFKDKGNPLKEAESAK